MSSSLRPVSLWPVSRLRAEWRVAAASCPMLSRVPALALLAAAAAPRRLQSTVKSHKSESVLNYNDVYVTQHS